MSAFQLGTNLVLTFVLASSLLFRYGNWYRHHVVITLAVLVAWYFSFIIIFVLPIDVSTTVWVQCLHTGNYNDSTNASSSNSSTWNDVCPMPWSSPGSEVLSRLWRVVYWSSQCLTWLILPIMQSYTKAGEFTIKGKLKSALRDNLIYYASYIFICGILLVYIVVKPNVKLPLDSWDKIKLIASSASNTWSLFLLVFMLGHGLVAVPRTLYKSSLPNHSLNAAYFKVAKLAGERNDSEELLEDALDTFHSASQSVSEPALVKHLDVIYTQIPTEFRERLKRRRPSPSDGTHFGEQELVKLNRLMKRALGCWHRTETLWAVGVNQAIQLEELEMLRRTGPGSRSRTSWSKLIQWTWTCVLHNHLLRLVAVCTGLLSLAVVWSEVTFFIRSPVLSLLAVFVGLARDDSYNYFAIEVVATLTIAYLCVCTYFTIFKIRFFNYYYLAGGHQTDEYSLIFCGMLLCRLTPALCLNFLGMVHMDSHVIPVESETSYTRVMGHLDVLSIISDGFNVYFPMGILVIGVLTWARVGARLLSAIGFQQFLSQDDEMTTDMIGQGSDLVKREKRRKQRQETATSRLQLPQSATGGPTRQQARYEDTASETGSRGTESGLTSREPGQRSYYGLTSEQQPPPRDLFDDV